MTDPADPSRPADPSDPADPADHTSWPPPLTPDDELASAYLDGELDHAGRSRVEADPELQARVDQLRSVAVQVAAVPPAGEHLDRHVAAALAVADEPPRSAGAAAPTPPVTALAGRRRTRRSPPPALVAAAVAVLLLFGLGLVVTSSNGRSNDEQSTAAGSGESDAGDGSADGSVETGESSPGAAGAPTPVDLGAFADETELRRALVATPPAPPGADEPSVESGASSGAPEDDAAGRVETVPPGGSGSMPAAGPTSDATREGGTDPLAEPSPTQFDPAGVRCADVAAVVDPALGALQAVRTASVGGRDVWVFTHADTERGDGAVVDTVADRVSCQVQFALAR